MKINPPVGIFIVDDNKMYTLALKAHLENAFKDMSIKIDLFETGEKCMERFLQEKPEVVILDYYLNNKYTDAADGIKVLNWIKKENKDTHVIMLTSNDHIDIALESFHHGASDYVVKTETHFGKINYSLLNLFKLMEAKDYARRYKRQIIALFLVVALLLGAIITFQILNH